MNLPEPSGSSPPENPPGSMNICALSMSSASSSTDSPSDFASRLRRTKMLVFAPAALKRRIVSYSQFVPGNTGMTTRGDANLTDVDIVGRLSQVKVSVLTAGTDATFVGNIPSSVDSHALCSSSIVTVASLSVSDSSLTVLPIRRQSNLSEPSASPAVSTINPP